MANCLNKWLDYKQIKKPLDPVIVNEKRFHLNKSKSKFVAVGLSYDFCFKPCITFSGNKTRPVLFNEFEWRDLLQYQGLLTNYFYSREVFAPIITSTFTLNFETYNDVKYIKLEGKNDSYICFGIESITQLWLLLPLIDYKLNMLKKQDFQTYFNTKVTIAHSRDGDIYQQILNDIAPSTNQGSDNIATIMELVYQHPDLPDFLSNNYNLQYYTSN